MPQKTARRASDRSIPALSLLSLRAGDCLKPDGKSTSLMRMVKYFTSKSLTSFSGSLLSGRSNSELPGAKYPCWPNWATRRFKTGHALLLAPELLSGHISPMVEKSRTRLLEVLVEPFAPPRWGWQVKAGSDVVAEGFENGQMEARFEGYNALFQLLAAGWDG
jgi:hypothetical protein